MTPVADRERRVIRPQPGPQYQFNACAADIAIAGGAAGGGKTWGLLLEPTRHIQNPAFGCVTFRRLTTQIRQEGGLWDQSFEIYPSIGGEPREQYTDWTFPSGARITFNHMEHPRNRFDWDGAQIPLIQFDQLEQFTEDQFFYMLSRNRGAAGIDPYIRATCNPVPPSDPTGGWLAKLLNWWWDDDTGYAIQERSGVWRWFLRVGDSLEFFDSREEAVAYRKDRGMPEDIQPLSLTFIPSTVEDNPILLENDPGYVAKLGALGRVERERKRHGNWKVKAAAGEFIDREWFDVIPRRQGPSTTDKALRWGLYWDKAGTAGGGDYTVGTLACWTDQRFYVVDVWRGQWSAGRREQVIEAVAHHVAELLGGRRRFRIWVEQEGGSGGKESAEATVQRLAGYRVGKHLPTGDKFERADPFAGAAENGNVFVLDSGGRRPWVLGPDNIKVASDWNEPWLTELHNADPDAAHLDQMDSVAGVFNKLTLTTGSEGVVWSTGRSRRG